MFQGGGTTTSNTQVFYFRETFLGECNGQTEFSSCTIIGRPRVDSVTPPRGLIGNFIAVEIEGKGFGSSPSVSAGTGIGVTVTEATDERIEATFNVAATAPAGNHQVKVTVNGKESIEPVNFFVQEPRRLVRLDFPGAPDGIGPLTIISPGNVVNLAGQTLLANQCGVYRNYAFDLVDQNADSIDGTYILEEWFDNYSGPVGTPATKTTAYDPGEIPVDTQYFGKTWPSCLGDNENESFRQHIRIRIGSRTFDLSTVFSISRGRFNGTHKVDRTVHTP
jgi:hypothetical protein